MSGYCAPPPGNRNTTDGAAPLSRCAAKTRCGVAALEQRCAASSRLARDEHAAVLERVAARPAACRRRRRAARSGCAAQVRGEAVRSARRARWRLRAESGEQLQCARRRRRRRAARAPPRAIDVRVGAADAERADAGAPRRPVARPLGAAPRSRRTALRSKSIAGFGASKCRLGGISRCRSASDRLDQARDAGRGVEVADVGLHRADARRSRCASVVCAERLRSAPRPRSGRRAACRCRAPRRSRSCPASTPATASASAIAPAWPSTLGAR